MNCRLCLNPVTYNGKEKHLIKKADQQEYVLSVCESCLAITIPDYNLKNKSRVFNSWNNISKFAFNVPDEVFQIAKKATYTREFNDEYRKKLSVKNTLQFHIDKYGKDEGARIYRERCQSRSCTLDNFIRRYGKDEGEAKWKKYIEKQSYSESLEYCLEKFGEEGYRIYTERCKNKALSEERFITKYGYEEGQLKWESYRKKYIESFQRRSPHSRKADLFFTELRKQLPTFLKIFDSSTGEKFFINKKGNFASVDFYIEDIDFAIEYYGDFWHANPKLYKSDDKIHTTYTAGDIWKRDSDRLEIIGAKKILIVWELEANNDKIEEIIKIINDELRDRN